MWFSCQGVTSILPVLREGVLTGSPEQKEEAAKALGLVIRLTSADALRPSVVNITGPLIRILGDRFSWNVKAALLETLSLLLAKVRTDRFTWSTRVLEHRSAHRKLACGVLRRQGGSSAWESAEQRERRPWTPDSPHVVKSRSTTWQMYGQNDLRRSCNFQVCSFTCVLRVQHCLSLRGL